MKWHLFSKIGQKVFYRVLLARLKQPAPQKASPEAADLDMLCVILLGLCSAMPWDTSFVL